MGLGDLHRMLNLALEARLVCWEFPGLGFGFLGFGLSTYQMREMGTGALNDISKYF